MSQTGVPGDGKATADELKKGIDWTVKGTIGAIEGYDETGKNSWRKSLDGLFCWAANDHNERNGLKAGDSMYLTPTQLKAQAMVESGGSKKDFLSDPMSANHKGDWGNFKKAFGLTKGQTMTPLASVAGGINILNSKAYRSDGSYKGMSGALRDYNGNTKTYNHPNGQQHRDWYAARVLHLAGGD